MKRLRQGYVIGRWQPFHNGHRALIEYGLRHVDNLLILVGGSDNARSWSDPWTFEERRFMIRGALLGINVPTERISDIVPLPDFPYNDDRWIDYVNDVVGQHCGEPDGVYGMVGFPKDHSSYYLDYFPDSERIFPEHIMSISGTGIRNHYFREAPIFPDGLVSKCVSDFLREFHQRPEFSSIVDERRYVEHYRMSWSQSPFPPTFVTCDAVCVQNDHVLLITRGEHPGKGLKSLPGGFVEGHKGDSLANVLCELREETAISDGGGPLTARRLMDFYTGHEARFDNPKRSVRGFTLTTAFLFRFPDSERLYEVAGGDDAADADWHHIDWIRQNPDQLYSDHWHIIMGMLTRGSMI